MHCKYVVIFIFIVVMKILSCHGFTQKAAKILYKNPKYVSEATILTSRKSRKAPYVTNLNCTILMSWDKNVSILAEVENIRAKSEKYAIKFKLCDGLKMKWIAEWLRRFSNVTPVCPIHVNTYYLHDLEFPPKNLPIQIPHGSYHVTCTAFLTLDPSEKILVVGGDLVG